MVAQESRQKLMKMLGEYGCYFLSIVHIAEGITGKRIDAIAAYIDAFERKWIDKEATVLDAGSVFSALTGGKYFVSKEGASYKTAANEYEVLVFKAKFTHFVAGDGTGKVVYDPLGNSNTVATGSIVEKRIFRKA
jgi:hypothetical protein